MARRSWRSEWRNYRTVFLLSMSVALGISVIARRSLRDVTIEMPAASDRVLQEALREEADHSDAVIGLLVDSILSIVQNYYVDEERIDERRLLDMALYKLTEDESVRLENAPDSYTLIKGQQRLTLPMSETFGYRELIEHGTKIARFLDDGQKRDAKLGWQSKGANRFVNAMLAGLDPHSALLDPDAYKELRQGTEGAFGGVGVVVGVRDNLLTVIKPLPRSPAARFGIHKNDRIMKINDISTFGVSLDHLVEHMRGAPGSVVNLSLLREGALSPETIAIKREVIQVDSVESKIVQVDQNKILHLTVESFASRTTREVRDAIVKAEKETQQKLAGVVLDLRSNPGGLLDQAVQVSDLFLKNGRIVSTIGRREEAENAGLGYTEFDYPLVVLINGESASASEIVAGALQDNDRAVVVGQPSFGKGSVQTIFELPGEQALKLTIARYYTPLGRSIQNVGIMPHIWLQPLAKNDSNSNLLGVQRYKNERFLANHLNNRKALPKDTRYTTAEYKGYYLVDRPSEGASEPADPEMDVAKQLIQAVAKHYGVPSPEGTRRAGHWLALTGKKIKQKLLAQEDVVDKYLEQAFKVDWGAQDVGASPAKSLRLTLTQNLMTAMEGDTVKIPWEMQNTSSKTIHRVSLYARSDSDDVNTYETLVGTLKPKEKRTGFFEFPVYMGFQQSTIRLQMGLAHDSEPIDLAPQKLTLAIQRRDRPQLSAHLELREDKGGRIPLTLEAEESGVLRVVVKNESKVSVKNVRVRVVNLSGTQVKVDTQEQKISELASGQSQNIQFDIHAQRQIVSAPLGVGVEVESEQMAEPLRQYFMIHAVPNASGRMSNLISRP